MKRLLAHGALAPTHSHVVWPACSARAPSVATPPSRWGCCSMGAWREVLGPLVFFVLCAGAADDVDDAVSDPIVYICCCRGVSRGKQAVGREIA